MRVRTAVSWCGGGWLSSQLQQIQMFSILFFRINKKHFHLCSGEKNLSVGWEGHGAPQTASLAERPSGPNFVRTVHLAVLQNDSVREWNGIP